MQKKKKIKSMSHSNRFSQHRVKTQAEMAAGVKSDPREASATARGQGQGHPPSATAWGQGHGHPPSPPRAAPHAG